MHGWLCGFVSITSHEPPTPTSRWFPIGRGWGPADTTRGTTLPGPALSVSCTACASTVPVGESLRSAVRSPTTKPAAVRVAWASPSPMPVTLGTVAAIGLPAFLSF
jgi:hypothetical protein